MPRRKPEVAKEELPDTKNVFGWDEVSVLI